MCWGGGIAIALQKKHRQRSAAGCGCTTVAPANGLAGFPNSAAGTEEERVPGRQLTPPRKTEPMPEALEDFALGDAQDGEQKSHLDGAAVVVAHKGKF